jgi:SNF2 family DNA or RNA helicase
MLVVDFHPTDLDFLTVKFKYFQDYITRIKKVPGATWSSLHKAWIIPIGALDWLEEEFAGELVYKTPRWVLVGEDPPDYSALYKVPNIQLPALDKPLKDYQEFGTKFMIDKLNKYGFVICADDVGLGKTPQAIAVMTYYSNAGKVHKTLVICKKSLKKQWKRDGIEKFTKSYKFTPNTMIADGDRRTRLKIYSAFSKVKDGVLITNYHTVMNDFADLAKLGFDMVIIDEAHKVATRTGVINKAICDTCENIPYTVFLTGTPVMSTPEDIYGIIQIADKKFFQPWKEFSKKHIVYNNKGRFTEIVGYRHLDELRDQVQDIIIRRTEHEVEVELPEMLTEKIEVEMDSVQDSINIKLKEDTQSLMDQIDRCKDKDRLKMLEGMLKGVGASRQAVANDPRLFIMSKSKHIASTYGRMVPQNYKVSPKTEALLELLQTIIDSGHKAIVFTKFERGVRLLQNDIEKELKVRVVSYSGKVDDDVRDQNVQDFWNDPDTKVFVANDAAAEGLNLQCAKYVVNYDQPDTPGIKTQRFGRVRRLDSAYSHVYMYDLITLGSKDEEKLDELENKSNLFDSVVSLNDAQSDAIRKQMKEGQQ